MPISGDFDDDEPAHGALLVGCSSDGFHQAAFQELRSRAMSIQFAGSKSLDDRRRRRLVVHSDDLGADEAVTDQGLSGRGLTSELVDSEAAAPWVPIYEWRIWTYAAILGLGVFASAFALSKPMLFRPELAPATKHLLYGPRPVLSVLIQTTFWFLSAQLAILIGWYRTRCKIDFRGRYRVWPWAAATFGIAAVCSATDVHGLFGQVMARSGLLPWRADVVSWLLPATLAALPLVLLLDRDVRRSRSSLYTLRCAWLMGFASVCLELFAADLNFLSWFGNTRIILPMFGSAALFVGLWLHARIVAYVCPDPPEADEATALAQLNAGWQWLVSRLLRPQTTGSPVPECEGDIKPKRGRKKVTADEEEAATTRRKRRTPAKRTTKPRTRIKAAEEEGAEEELEAQGEAAYGEESRHSSSGYESTADEAEANSAEWGEEPEPEIETPVNRWTRDGSHASNSSPPKPAAAPTEELDEVASNDEDDDSGDTVLRRDSGLTADQFKGLSKRQKRELRRQSREQQRNQRR